MKAKIRYPDYIGSSAAEILGLIASHYGDNIESVAKFFKLDLHKLS